MDHIKYSLHLVRPDRFFVDHADALHMPTITKGLSADLNVYERNQLMKFPNQSKFMDDRVQSLISGELS